MNVISRNVTQRIEFVVVLYYCVGFYSSRIFNFLFNYWTTTVFI